MMLFSDPGEVIAGGEINASNRSVVARGHTTRVAVCVLAVNTFSNMATMVPWMVWSAECSIWGPGGNDQLNKSANS